MKHDDLAWQASKLAPRPGYNPTALVGMRILRSETVLEDVPVLYRPGVVFVLQGAKQGFLDGQIYRYDADHYLGVSVPVPFRMASQASPEMPLLALYVEFDLHLAAEIAVMLEDGGNIAREQARSLVSSPLSSKLRDLLRRTMSALADPQECAILGPGILRELHYLVLVGPQGGRSSGGPASPGACRTDRGKPRSHSRIVHCGHFRPGTGGRGRYECSFLSRPFQGPDRSVASPLY